MVHDLRVKYRPDLDGIRALAILAVMAHHTEMSAAGGGWMGVDIFFVLSGFLITTLLLEEWDKKGHIALGQFYLRRVLRLYPALLALLVVGCFFYRYLGYEGTFAGYGRTALLAGTYVEDFATGIFHNSFGNLDPTWSLAVEEQFYLLWPPTLIVLLRYKRDPLKWAIGVTIVSWGLMIISMHPGVDFTPDASYYLPWNRFSQLTVGCALAIVVARGIAPRVVARPWFGWSAVAACLALIALAAKFYRYPNLPWQAPAIALATAALVWHLNSGMTALRRMLGAKPLAYLGRRSYGLYLYHYPVVIVLAAEVHGRRIERSVLMVIISLVLAIVSYRFIELPFLKLKGRFSPLRTGEAAASAAGRHRPATASPR